MNLSCFHEKHVINHAKKLIACLLQDTIWYNSNHNISWQIIANKASNVKTPKRNCNVFYIWKSLLNSADAFNLVMKKKILAAVWVNIWWVLNFLTGRYYDRDVRKAVQLTGGNICFKAPVGRNNNRPRSWCKCLNTWFTLWDIYIFNCTCFLTIVLAHLNWMLT